MQALPFCGQAIFELRGRNQTVSASKKTTEQKQPSMVLYAVVGVICAIAVVAVLVFNSGILHRSMTALTVNGTEYSAADMQYYYNMVSSQEYTTSQTYAMYGMEYDFDYTQKPEDQIYDEASGQTWDEYFVQQAKEYVTDVTALYDKAKAEGHQLTADGQAMMQSMHSTLETAWVGQYNSRDAFIRTNYGPHMTYERFLELVEREVMASDFGNLYRNSLSYTQQQREDYYAQNKDLLDSFTMTQFVLRASVDSTQEMTEEEKTAALEQDKAEKQALALEIQQRLQEGEDPEALAKEYEEELFSSQVKATRNASSIAASSYAEWALDAGRKSGDVTVAEYDSGTAYMYYVAQYGERFRDETKTANVRHILVGTEGTGEPTEEQYEAAKEKAQLLLDLWQSSGGDEETFAGLAAGNSADASSASKGGLIEHVGVSSGYVQTFTDWALAPGRKSGDTGLVKNTGSSVKGWHVMYYISDDLPEWALQAQDALAEEDYLAWESAATEGYEAVEGSGMSFVG